MFCVRSKKLSFLTHPTFRNVFCLQSHRNCNPWLNYNQRLLFSTDKSLIDDETEIDPSIVDPKAYEEYLKEKQQNNTTVNNDSNDNKNIEISEEQKQAMAKAYIERLEQMQNEAMNDSNENNNDNDNDNMLQKAIKANKSIPSRSFDQPKQKKPYKNDNKYKSKEDRQFAAEFKKQEFLTNNSMTDQEKQIYLFDNINNILESLVHFLFFWVCVCVCVCFG